MILLRILAFRGIMLQSGVGAKSKNQTESKDHEGLTNSLVLEFKANSLDWFANDAAAVSLVQEGLGTTLGNVYVTMDLA